MKLELVITNDGSHSIYRSDLEEQYHSTFGAIQESEHIFIKCGLSSLVKNHIRIFEMGFGTGLNVLLTCMAVKDTIKEIEYFSIEKFPLPAHLWQKLNYPALLPNGSREIFEKIHEENWDSEIKLGNLVLTKMHADILDYSLPTGIDLVYYDAFSPEKEPGLWNEEIFRKLYAAMNPRGVFVTYSAKGDVKRGLAGSGFQVEKLAGPPGKKHILRAVK